MWELTAYNVDESLNEFFVPMLATVLSSDVVSCKYSPLPAVKDAREWNKQKSVYKTGKVFLWLYIIYNCVHVLPIISFIIYV